MTIDMIRRKDLDPGTIEIEDQGVRIFVCVGVCMLACVCVSACMVMKIGLEFFAVTRVTRHQPKMPFKAHYRKQAAFLACTSHCRDSPEERDQGKGEEPSPVLMLRNLKEDVRKEDVS